MLQTVPYKSEYICRSTGIRSSRLRMYPEEFLRIKLLCPPPEEQRAIVEIVSKESVDARRAIDLAQGELSLLREYRTRLIADVVTGKFDVREAAARLPDAVEGLEPLDEADGRPRRGPPPFSGATRTRAHRRRSVVTRMRLRRTVQCFGSSAAC